MFQTIRPVVSRKKRGFSAHFGPGCAVPPPRVSPLKKVKRPGRIKPLPLCTSRLLPGADGGSPARRGAWGERGKIPSTPPAPPYSPLSGTRNLSLESDHTPSAACRMGHRREPSPALAGVMSAPAAALRPPCGRTGSPSRPRHAASAARTKGASLPGDSEGEKLADGRTVLPHVRGKLRSFLDIEGNPLCFAVFGRHSLFLCVSLFSKLEHSIFPNTRSKRARLSARKAGPFYSGTYQHKLKHFQFETLCVSNHTACRFAEKARFFRSLWAGRRCAAASRFTFLKVEKL